MLKVGSVVLLLALTLLPPYMFRLPIVQASSQTIVKVDPNTSSANLSAKFTINIKIIDVQDLYAVEVTLNWNSSVLTLANIDTRLGEADGVLYGSPFIAENSTKLGKYSLAATSVGPAPPFNGSGTIVKIAFEVTGLGNSQLDLGSQLYDYAPPDRNPRISLPIDHTTIGGFFAILGSEQRDWLSDNWGILVIGVTLAVIIIGSVYIALRPKGKAASEKKQAP